MLTLERVTKRFGGLTAVREVSLEVREGDLLGIIGPNGAGKTTLFNVISGYYRPDGGRVLLAGRDVGGEPPHVICRLGLTRTFQIVKPFGNLSVLDNVMIGALTRLPDRRPPPRRDDRRGPPRRDHARPAGDRRLPGRGVRAC